LIGRKSKDEIEFLYKTVPIDLFINLSTTEGVPVSIMEAMSFGIPVLATEVGGNSEIVDETTGALVPSNSNLDYLVNRISLMLADRNDLNSKRDQCYEKWKNCFNSEINYPLFIDSIHQILSTKQDIGEFN
jgi:glycosyltransferase involved in cell wall biosynthesis